MGTELQACAFLEGAIVETLGAEAIAALVTRLDESTAKEGAWVRIHTGNELFKRYEVIPLLSPPGCPAYNGACEAGIGGLQAAIHIEAARFDRSGEWTCDDVERARRVANAEHHPWGLAQPAPDQAWAARTPIPHRLRQTLAASVAQLIPEARLKLQIEPNIPWDQLNRWKQGAVLREAVRRALVEHGILRIRRKRFSPPIAIKKVSGIT